MRKTNKISIEYDESTYYNIYELYQKNDFGKLNKYIHAHSVMRSKDGWGLKIIHHNKYGFSCAFVFEQKEENI